MSKNNIVEKWQEIEDSITDFIKVNCSTCDNSTGWPVYEKDLVITDNKIWCNVCGLIYQNKRWSHESASKFYNEFYLGKYFQFRDVQSKVTVEEAHEIFYDLNYKGRRDQIYVLEDLILKANTVLDLGCSSGGPLRHLTDINKSSVGTDLNTHAMKVARSKGLTTIELDITQGVQKFDLIFCSNVIEHLIDPNEFVKGIELSLNTGGKLAAIVPYSDNKPEGPHVPHVYNFTQKSFVQFMESMSNLRFVERRYPENKKRQEMIIIFEVSNNPKTYSKFDTTKAEYDEYKKKLDSSVFWSVRRFIDKSVDRDEYDALVSIYKDLPMKNKKITDWLIWSKLYRVFTFKRAK